LLSPPAIPQIAVNWLVKEYTLRQQRK